MNETASGPSAPPGYAETVNRNIKAELARAGKRPADLEAADALNLSHSRAMRRLSGETEWRLSEIEQVAGWLGIDLERLTSPR